MISKQYFEESFSISTAQALQVWADNNLIVQGFGDYALKIAGNQSGSTFGEVELSPLVVGVECTVSMYFEEIFSNNFSIRINSLPNDNASTIQEEGWNNGVGQRFFTFTPTETTMYLAIGDNVGSVGTYSIVDNVKVNNGTTDIMTNGDFEDTTTDPWYSQNGTVDLTSYEYSPAIPLPPENDYLEPINIPPYDSGDPTHFRITNNSGWGQINNDAYTHFYVDPGNYSSLGQVVITASGTSINRKSISLYTPGNDSHPGQLDIGDLAEVKLTFNTSSYWDIDRMSHVSQFGQQIYRVQSGASNIVFNRLYTEDSGISVWIQISSDITVQNSWFKEMRESSRLGDQVCIHLVDWSSSDYTIQNAKIINNDIRNQNDGIMVQKSGLVGAVVPNLEGLVIDGNRIWIDSDVYCDSDGTLNPSGLYAQTENAIDLKSGSTNSNNPITITNNYMWGMRKTVPQPIHDSGDHGYCMSAHYNTKYVNINNNVFYDAAGGFGNGAAIDTTYDGENMELNGNLFYETGPFSNASENRVTFVIGSSRWIDAIGNAFINLRDDGNAFNVRLSANKGDITFNQNDFVDSIDTINQENNTGSNYVLTPNNTGTAVELGYTEDVTWDYDVFTNSPQSITLTNAAKA